MNGKPTNVTECYPTPCLFDVQNDISETTDLASDPNYAHILKKL